MFKKIKKFFKKDSDIKDTKVSINFTSGPLPNWSIVGNNNRMVFKIPVGAISKEDAHKSLRTLMMAYNKSYWLPTKNIEKLEKIIKIINSDK